MKPSTIALVAVFAAGGLAGWMSTVDRGPTAVARQNSTEPVVHQTPVKAEGAEAGIKSITAEYVKAFNAADAKGAAALWTTDGEYIGADGNAAAGRAEIEKTLAAFFKASPKTVIEVKVESVRAMGRGLAAAEGVVLLKVPGDAATVESKYSALHVLEEGKWHAASVSEWVLDPATDVTPKQLEWLIGEWEAKGDAGELRITYAWDTDKVFITGVYTLTKDGRAISKGTQVIGRNPAGGLRSWMFDSTGATSDAIWTRDGKSWISEAYGVLPDGAAVNSVNVVVPLGPDAFTWQTTEHEVDGAPSEGLPPVKVTRVKK